jgi:hypothetical protein
MPAYSAAGSEAHAKVAPACKPIVNQIEFCNNLQQFATIWKI